MPSDSNEASPGASVLEFGRARGFSVRSMGVLLAAGALVLTWAVALLTWWPGPGSVISPVGVAVMMAILVLTMRPPAQWPLGVAVLGAAMDGAGLVVLLTRVFGVDLAGLARILLEALVALAFAGIASLPLAAARTAPSTTGSDDDQTLCPVPRRVDEAIAHIAIDGQDRELLAKVLAGRYPEPGILLSRVGIPIYALLPTTSATSRIDLWRSTLERVGNGMIGDPYRKIIAEALRDQPKNHILLGLKRKYHV